MGRFDYSSQPLRGKNTAATEMLTNVLQFLLVKYGGSEETTSAIHISLVRYLKGEGKNHISRADPEVQILPRHTSPLNLGSYITVYPFP
jgi:hypothetical protein